MQLTDRKVLVTGAAVGIGRAVAVRLARAGADVAVHHVSPEEHPEAVVDEIAALGRRAVALQADLTDADAAAGLAARAAAALGGLDGLVNNAGLTINSPLEEMPDAQLGVLLDLNLRGPMLVSRGALAHLKRAAAMRDAAGTGAPFIVNVSSVHAVAAMPEYSVYGATKAAVAAFSRSLALELAPFGIIVNAVAPGWIFVESQRRALGTDFDPVAAGEVLPAGRLGRPEDVAEAVHFLATASGFVIGTTLIVDGGQLARLGGAAALPTEPFGTA